MHTHTSQWHFRPACRCIFLKNNKKEAKRIEKLKRKPKNSCVRSGRKQRITLHRIKKKKNLSPSNGGPASEKKSPLLLCSTRPCVVGGTCPTSKSTGGQARNLNFVQQIFFNFFFKKQNKSAMRVTGKRGSWEASIKTIKSHRGDFRSIKSPRWDLMMKSSRKEAENSASLVRLKAAGFL